jgi:hypothetical protein
MTKRRNAMKKFTTLSLGVLLGFALAASVYAAEGQKDAGKPSGTEKKTESPSQPAPGPIISPQTAGHVETVEGELLRIDRDIYVVKDPTGKEVSLKVDKDTKMEGNIVLHDQIVVRATAMKKQHTESAPWHADSIKKR